MICMHFNYFSWRTKYNNIFPNTMPNALGLDFLAFERLHSPEKNGYGTNNGAMIHVPGRTDLAMIRVPGTGLMSQAMILAFIPLGCGVHYSVVITFVH